MHINKEVGEKGEEIVAKYLEEKKYKILERNYRRKLGEIDIIAIDKKTKEIVFVEVKTRTSLKYGEPREAVKRNKQEHIRKVALTYNLEKHNFSKPFRFDVIEVNLNNNKYKLNHIKQAF